MTDCQCLRVAETVRRSMASKPLPHCPQHNPTADPGSAVALNDGPSLAALIGAELTNTTEEIN